MQSPVSEPQPAGRLLMVLFKAAQGAEIAGGFYPLEGEKPGVSGYPASQPSSLAAPVCCLLSLDTGGDRSALVLWAHAGPLLICSKAAHSARARLSQHHPLCHPCVTNAVRGFSNPCGPFLHLWFRMSTPEPLFSCQGTSRWLLYHSFTFSLYVPGTGL